MEQAKPIQARTRWVFADRVVYAFWAGLPVPPELAVTPRKRIWSGQLTEAELLECLERYRPERLLLLSSRTDWPGLSDCRSDPLTRGRFMIMTE